MLLGTGTAVAQEQYPSKVIRIITPATGGGADVVAHLIAPGLTAALGQQVLVDNRGGTASEIVARSRKAVRRDNGGFAAYSYLQTRMTHDP